MKYNYKPKKKKGRPNSEYKIRKFKPITPKGYEFHSVDEERQELVYKKKKTK